MANNENEITASREIMIEFLNVLYSGFFNKVHENMCLVLTTATTDFKNLEFYWYKLSEIDVLVEQALHASKDGLSVYINICPQDQEAAYAKKGNIYTRGDEYTVVAVPGFWIDIDIKGPGHSKSNLPETMEDALQLLEAVPFPPSMIVSTGGGIHAYWILEEPFYVTDNVQRDKAKSISAHIQSSIIRNAKEKGLAVDNTKDLARLYRMAGSVNRKNDPKLVKIMQKNDCRYRFADFEALLTITSESQKEQTPRKLNEELPDADLIYEKCIFTKHCKDDAETLSEPEWYAVISYIPLCKNGREIAHDLSRPYPGYSEAETDKKIDQAISSAGPRTCANIEEMTGGCYCEHCEYKGKITSPIQLGYKRQRLPLSTDTAKQIAELAVKAVVNGNKEAYLADEAISAFAVLQRTDFQYYARLKLALQEAKVGIRDFNRLVKFEGQKQLALVRERKQIQGNTIVNNFPDAPIPHLLIPAEYSVRNNGVYIETVTAEDEEPQSTLITHNPVIISAKYKDLEEANEILELSWKRNGRWESCLADRGMIADARKILQLADMGFPCHSINSGDLVKYLADLEALNENTIPVQFVSCSMGWKRIQGSRGFLLANRFITKGKDTVLFRGLTSGDDQIARGFHGSGDYEKWKEAVSVIKNYPRVLAMFYGSFSSIMLEVLNCSNFVAEVANKTSTGKTIALRVAASAWGCPDEKSSDSIIFSWDHTKVWGERASAIVNGLPLFLDDTKRTKHPKQISEMIYSVANGRGRGRGNVKNLAMTKSWRTVLMSTAETPSVFTSTDGGTRGRVLEICGLPFEKKSEEMRQLVSDLDLKLKANYGFAGPAFVEYVLENEDQWGRWKKELNQLESYFAQKESSEVSGRLAGYAALISLTGKLVHEAIQLPWEFCCPMETLWAGIVTESKDATGELAALQYVVSWAYSNMERFEGKEGTEGVTADSKKKTPASGWAGRWLDKDSYIAFLPNVLKKVLGEAGYDPEAIIRGWRDLQWLDLNDKSRSTRQLRFQGATTWMIPIRKKAICLLDGDTAEAFEDIPSLKNMASIDSSCFPINK